MWQILRAPTPSAAAELAVFDYRQFEAARLSYQALFNQAMERKTETARYRAEQYRLRLKLHDRQRNLREQRQHLADMEENVKRAMEQRLTGARHRLALLGGRLHGAHRCENQQRLWLCDGCGGKTAVQYSLRQYREKKSACVFPMERIRAQVIETIPYQKTLDYRQKAVIETEAMLCSETGR